MLGEGIFILMLVVNTPVVVVVASGCYQRVCHNEMICYQRVCHIICDNIRSVSW